MGLLTENPTAATNFQCMAYCLMATSLLTMCPNVLHSRKLNTQWILFDAQSQRLLLTRRKCYATTNVVIIIIVIAPTISNAP